MLMSSEFVLNGSGRVLSLWCIAKGSLSWVKLMYLIAGYATRDPLGEMCLVGVERVEDASDVVTLTLLDELTFSV